MREVDYTDHSIMCTVLILLLLTKLSTSYEIFSKSSNPMDPIRHEYLFEDGPIVNYRFTGYSLMGNPVLKSFYWESNIVHEAGLPQYFVPIPTRYEPVSEDLLYVQMNGDIYCIEPSHVEIIWSKSLIMTYDYVNNIVYSLTEEMGLVRLDTLEQIHVYSDEIVDFEVTDGEMLILYRNKSIMHNGLLLLKDNDFPQIPFILTRNHNRHYMSICIVVTIIISFIVKSVSVRYGVSIPSSLYSIGDRFIPKW